MLFSILSSVTVAVLIKINEQKNLNRLGIMFGNYLTATALSLAFLIWQGPVPVSGQLLGMSAFTGLIFFGAFVAYMKSVRNLGLTIPVTITRISVVIPVLGSIFLFSEYPNPFQILGLILALLTIALFSSISHLNSAETRVTMRTLWLSLTLFFLIGMGDFSLKIFEKQFSGNQLPVYMALVFCFSGILTYFTLKVQRVKLTRAVLVAGIILGVPNFLSAFFILKALQRLPGTVAFPINNIGIIIFSFAIGFHFWKEKINWKIVVGLLTAIAAVIFLNVPSP